MEIIRVRNHAEARQEARLHGLHWTNCLYIDKREDLQKMRPSEGMTYYINNDLHQGEIEYTDMFKWMFIAFGIIALLFLMAIECVVAEHFIRKYW